MSGLSASRRIGYLIDSGVRMLSDSDRSCPACRSGKTFLLRRKYLVTALWQCPSCHLRFRVPKEHESQSRAFYQTDYSEGFTTDCPSDDALDAMLKTSFRGLEKDFCRYIRVLRAAGIKDGDSVLDFGCSWGYGSWQLREAGFRVYSYEISRPRAEYARQKLGCTVIESLDTLPETIKCLFSAHVIEHLPDPNLVWQTATRLLDKDGVIVCICPNGDPSRETKAAAGSYDQLWGKVHPLLITPDFLTTTSGRHGWSAHCYTRPFELDKIASRSAGGDCSGDELCMVAHPSTATS